MPKVLRILNRFNLGGPTFNAAYLTKYLAPEYDTLLIAGEIDENESSSKFIIDNLGLHTMTIKEMKRDINLAGDMVAYNKIKAIIKKYKPDIVHTHASKAGMLGRRAAYNCDVPVIVHTFHGHIFHSYFNSIQSNTYIEIEKKLAKRTNQIIAISDNQKHELSNIYNITKADKISVIPLGLDLSRFREKNNEKRDIFRNQFNIKEDEIAIGIVGRLVPIKNHIHFIEALKYVITNSKIPIRAFIVGDGESKNIIENKAKELKIDYCDLGKDKCESTLTFTSWIKDVDYVYAGLDIVALTSLNEGTPVSLIEAQAANKPIVTTDVGGIKNVIIPDVTALLADSNVINDFAEKLLSLVENHELRIKLSQKGWENVKEKFHYTRLIKDMSELYSNLLKK